jgi:hypothetical protein
MAGSAAKLPASATATRSSMISNAVSAKGQELRPIVCTGKLRRAYTLA